jgi:hypothetical protein
MELLKAVVRYSNGSINKGFAQDFFPQEDRFHLFPSDSPSEEAIEIFLKELKAVFFVRDFTGNPLYHERKEYLNGEKPSGSKVEVTFMDGEVLVGSNYDVKPHGFFFFPADPKSNNLKVFAVSSAVKRGRFL